MLSHVFPAKSAASWVVAMPCSNIINTDVNWCSVCAIRIVVPTKLLRCSGNDWSILEWHLVEQHTSCSSIVPTKRFHCEKDVLWSHSNSEGKIQKRRLNIDQIGWRSLFSLKWNLGLLYTKIDLMIRPNNKRSKKWFKDTKAKFILKSSYKRNKSYSKT